MSTTDERTDIERHVMVFSDVEVEVVLFTDGDYEVNFRRSGDAVVSFSGDNWGDIPIFVTRSVQMTEGA